MGGRSLTEQQPHSYVLACDFKVDAVDRVWEAVSQHRDTLAQVGAHHLVVYSALWDPSRVFVTTGIRAHQSIERIVRSPNILQWFDAFGVDDLPPVFGGEVVEKIDLVDGSSMTADGVVVLAVIATVADVDRLVAGVHEAEEQFRSAGVRRVWIYRALDDSSEVMILEEIDSEDNVRKWIDKPDAAAEWMSGAGLGAYPPMFIGRFAHLMAID